MTLGSFTVDNKQINVSTDYNQVDGMVYRFILAATKQQIAVTNYRGIDVTDDRFSKEDLQRGLNVVRRQAARR